MSGMKESHLAHYGVKGMRWGVRKSDQLTGRDYTSAVAQLPKLTATEAVAMRKQAQESFMAKSNASEAGRPSDRSLSPGQKKALYIGVGALTAAAVVGGSAYMYSRNGKAELPPSATAYLEQIRHTNQGAFPVGGTSFHPTAVSREGFSLPAGHVFSRVSTVAEKSFADTTYTSFNSDDYNRYLGEGYGRTIGYASLHRIQFSAKEEIRVPSFTDTVETLRETMFASGRMASPTDALKEYNRLQGSDFTDAIGSSFLERLRSKGYSAIIDEMDSGRIGDRPLVIIDPSKFTDKAATPLTPQDVLAARKAMTPLPTPKL